MELNLFYMKNPSQLLPMEIGGFKMRQLEWSDFKGQINSSMPWSAHIYWWIEYQITDPKKRKISLQLHISGKSWVRPEKKCGHLLNHEQGHYVIGSLCALQFLRRLDKNKQSSQGNFQQLALQTFDRTMKEYIELQKKYDRETEHRLNYKRQEQWDEFLYDRLTYYLKSYDKSKKTFMTISKQSPQKQKRVMSKKRV